MEYLINPFLSLIKSLYKVNLVRAASSNPPGYNIKEMPKIYIIYYKNICDNICNIYRIPY